jgi:hypothetical protein
LARFASQPTWPPSSQPEEKTEGTNYGEWNSAVAEMAILSGTGNLVSFLAEMPEYE